MLLMEERCRPMPQAVTVFLSMLACIPGLLFAANEDIIQSQRQKALEKQLQPPTPDVRLSLPGNGKFRMQFPAETPCFSLERIELEGVNDFPRWLPLQRIANQAVGKCLGGQGINLLMSTLQNRLIDSGYVTSRVLAPPQDLTQGTLQLNMLAGKVSRIGRSPDSGSYINLWSAIPARAGTLFDLRDTEQGLENLQRLPTVQAEMALQPGSAPGESDLDIQ